MNLSLTILGTASAMPVSDRNPSAQVLAVHGRLFLIDCAEGTQQKFRQAKLSFLKVRAILISHIHGDHVFGLFGMLNTMAMLGRTEPLDIFGPASLEGLLNFYRNWFSDGDDYTIGFHPLKGRDAEKIYEDKNISISAFPLNHKIECYGYRFGDSYAYCSDTAAFPEESSYVAGVHTLYHEGTYNRELADKAASRYHSTTIDAANCARDAGVKRLILGHYSKRIHDFDSYIAEAREIFPESYAAQDGDVLEIPYLSGR